MSTRCQIAVYESKDTPEDQWTALIYRHYDGYPGTPDGKDPGILADIVPFLKEFEDKRGMNDAEYCAARLLQHLANDEDY